MEMYARADKAIRQMNRTNLRLFGKLKILPIDELNVMSATKAVYGESIRTAKKKYLNIGYWAFIDAMLLAGAILKDAEKQVGKVIVPEWVTGILKDFDPVTLYRFMNEAERKRVRLAEAMIASNKRNREIDKALRYWTLQTSQYAINVTDRATIAGYKAAGVKKVKWVTERDEKVCDACDVLDGAIFDIDNVPPKQHYNCRCTVVPV